MLWGVLAQRKMHAHAGVQWLGQNDHTRNILLLYAARGVRGFGDGFATIILPAYLIAIGYDPIQIGIVLAASLLGTAVLTLGRRRHCAAPRSCAR